MATRSTAKISAHTDKGIPVTGQHHPPLCEAVSLPVLVLHETPLAHNLAWMQQFADAHHARLAPHGKTTMTPALFQRQLKAGAWGITLATAAQCRAAYTGGVRRLLIANQLVGRANMTLIADLLQDDEVDFYCLVDSEENIRALGKFFGAREVRLQVLVEFGLPGGRSGCRSPAEAHALAEAVAREPALALAGVEGYEGIIHGDNAEQDVRAYTETLVNTALEISAAGLLAVDEPIITAAGSKWYDITAEAFDRAELREHFAPVLRPGCYITHDHGVYLRAQEAIRARNPDFGEGLRPAAEVWAHVQSIPEPGRAIAALGRRDVAFDADMPLPLRRYRAADDFRPRILAGWSVARLMDQHAFLDIPADADVEIGDIIAFGISHPCTTFDKWRQVCLVDEALNVVEVMPTRF